MKTEQRLITLDAMRGFAALLILIGHANLPFTNTSDYLAVDFFFLLSGFVIARAYDGRLQNGMSGASFMKARLIRLYPLLLLGVLIGILRALRITLMAGPDALSPSQLSVSVFFALFALPSPATIHAFPINPPAWSLFFELAVNAIYAVWLVRASTRRLVWLVAVFAVVLVYVAFRNGSLNGGYLWPSLHVGAVRVLFGFTLGALLSRLHHVPATRSSAAYVSMLALVVTLILPVPPGLRVVFDLGSTMLLMPALLWSGASFNPPARFDRIGATLGALSYPVYAIHFPIVNVMASVAASRHVSALVWLPCGIAVIACIAGLALKFWDQPLRLWLGRARIAVTAAR